MVSRKLYFNLFNAALVTGAPPKAGTGLKMQIIFFFKVTLWGIYRWLKIYRGLVTYGSLIRHFGKHEEYSQEKDFCFLGNETLPNLDDALVYEGKFLSEYLERQIYERLLKSEPSIVKNMRIGATYQRWVNVPS